MESDLDRKTPAYWRKQAEDARALAQRMMVYGGKETMEEIAALYDRMADGAEARKG